MRDFRTFSHIQKRCARSTVSPSFNRPLPAKKNFANKNFVISHIPLHHNPSIYHPSTYAEKLSHHPTSYFNIVWPNPWRVGEDSHNFPDPPPVGPCKRIGRDDDKNIDRKLPTYDISLTAFTQLAFAITFQPLISNQSQMTTSFIF